MLTLFFVSVHQPSADEVNNECKHYACAKINMRHASQTSVRFLKMGNFVAIKHIQFDHSTTYLQS
jgi:hypothetical protein